MKKIKNKEQWREYEYFQLHESAALREYLEDKALDGWVLAGYRSGFLFEKTPSRRLHYFIDVRSDADFGGIGAKDTKRAYLLRCSEAGWRYICTTGKCRILLREDGGAGDAPPTDTTDSECLKTIAWDFVANNIFWWIASLFSLLHFLAYYASSIPLGDINQYLSSNRELMGGLIHILWRIWLILQAANILIWLRKNKKRIQNGLPIAYLTRQAKRRLDGNRSHARILLLLPFFTVTLYALRKQNYNMVFVSGAVSLLGLIIVMLFFILGKGKIPAKILSVFGMAGSVTCLILLLLALPRLVNISSGVPTLLAAQDLGLTALSPERSSASVLAQMQSGTLVTNDGARLEYQILRSGFSPVFRMMREGELKRIVRREGSLKKLPDAAGWQAAALYETAQTRLVLYDGLLFSCSKDFPLTDAQIRVIAEKLRCHDNAA